MPLSKEPLLPAQEDVQQEPSTPGASQARRWRLIVVVVVCVGILPVLGGTLHRLAVLPEALDALVEFCRYLGWLTPVLMSFMSSIMNVLMLPTCPLMVFAGTVFPRMYGVILGEVVAVIAVFSGMWVGSVMAFLLGRKFFKRWATRELEKFAWMRTVNALIEDQGWWVVMLARATPMMPVEVFNYACALTTLSPTDYAVGCLGSLLPTCLWVCSAASADVAAGTAGQGGASGEAGKLRHTVLLVCINVTLLGALSTSVFFAVKRVLAAQSSASLAAEAKEAVQDEEANDIEKVAVVVPHRVDPELGGC